MFHSHPFRGLVTAVRTLTIIPIRGQDAEKLSASLPWFPMVGWILGLILWSTALLWVNMFGPAWTAGGAVILVAGEILLTRGLHLDGLADWADALGGGRNRESRLLIMKDAHLGTFGVLALVMVLLAKFESLHKMFVSGTVLYVVPSMIISRDRMVSLITCLPYARAEEGTAKPFVKDASPKQARVSLLITLASCLCFGPMGMILFITGLGISKFLRRSFRRSFGGITGDLLGTTNELVETLLLLFCATAGDLLSGARLYGIGWGIG